MDYFTSDLHIGHNKEFIWKARGFSSIEEHDTEIIKRWNGIITHQDTVYILGDLCMSGDEKEWNRVYKALNGTIYFITGNHDTFNKIIKYIDEYNMYWYTGIKYDNAYKYSKNKSFYLSHYPTLVGNYGEEKKFLWNLSGHTHSLNKFEYGIHHIYNVAMDAHNCTPVSIEQIIEDIENYIRKNKI